MKRLSLLSLLFLLALPLAAQSNPPAPAVSAISPASGSVAGGTVVAILGANLSLPPGFACILPCPTIVSFDGVEAALRDERNESLVVLTPAHAADTVDITIRTGDGRSLVLNDAFTYVQSNSPGYEALLLPVYLDGTVSGAQGSRWKSEFWIRNFGSKDVQLAPWVCPDGGACPAVFPLTRTLAVAEAMKNLPAFFRPPTTNVGRMLYVTADGAKSVATSLRLWDESRQALDAGAEIPVVREGEFLTSTAHLMSVPLNGSFRVMLRVYETNLTEARFHVRVYEQVAGNPAEVPLTQTTLVATNNESGPFRVAPAYAQWSGLDDILPVITPARSLVRVEVIPETPGSVFWTFIAITNNETQRVTLVTP